MKFDENTLRKLRTLTLVATEVRAGILQGDRRSSKRGTSIEFADYRDYVPGDDLRRLDWNVYARLERPFIKLFEDEEDLSVNIFLDTSKSMDWGDEEENKFDYGRKLAAGLCSIALSTGDRLTAAMLSEGAVSAKQGPSRGGHNTLRFLEFLESQKSSGKTNISRALQSIRRPKYRPGLTIVISDLLDPSGYQAGLKHLQNQGHEVIVLHIMAPTELEPPIAGDLRLLDIETGQAQEVSLDGGIRRLYRHRIMGWRTEIMGFCRKRGMRCLPLSTDTPWDKVILESMRREGVVK